MVVVSDCRIGSPAALKRSFSVHSGGGVRQPKGFAQEATLCLFWVRGAGGIRNGGLGAVKCVCIVLKGILDDG